MSRQMQQQGEGSGGSSHIEGSSRAWRSTGRSTGSSPRSLNGAAQSELAPHGMPARRLGYAWRDTNCTAPMEGVSLPSACCQPLSSCEVPKPASLSF